MMHDIEVFIKEVETVLPCKKCNNFPEFRIAKGEIQGQMAYRFEVIHLNEDCKLYGLNYHFFYSGPFDYICLSNEIFKRWNTVMSGEYEILGFHFIEGVKLRKIEEVQNE